MPDRRRLLIFVATVFGLILVFSIGWLFIAPGYASLLAAATDKISPSSISLTATGSSIVLQSETQQASISLNSLPLQAGLILLVTLIIATPGLRVKQRLYYVAIGAVLTFVLHVISILIMSTNVRALRPLIVLFASVGIDLFPVLIWAGLSARYWWPGRETPA